jgi:serine/threonine-protein kinase
LTLLGTTRYKRWRDSLPGMRVWSSPVSRPQTYGAYDLLARINVGGMAEVFRAKHRESKRLVAIKRILPSIAEDDEFIAMFRDEAAIASQLDHPNIAKILDIGRVDSSCYIAFEFVEGKDMRTVFDNALRTRASLPIDLVLHVVAGLCQGLDYAHQRKDGRGKLLGLVHRDVSPQNILISYRGEVKLIDFGIAKAAGKLARTKVGAIKGKFGYMSPEQVRGLPVDARSDIFSAGICLWELLTMQRLFQADSEIMVMERIRNADVPPPTKVLPSVAVELERVAMRALAKNIDDRYTCASDLAADLSAFAHTEGIALQRERVADYLRRAFPADAAQHATPREETHVMAENKGGSDLDVFEGLARKPQTRPANAPPSVPLPGGPPSRPGAPPPPPARAKTLMGMAPLPMPVPPPAAAAPPVARLHAVPPPAAAPAPPLPPPPASGPAPLPPPSRGSGVLPAVAPPPPRTSAPPPPAPSRSGVMPAPAALPPVTAPGALPPVTAPPMAGAQARPATVDMDWDDEDEKTHVYDKQSAEDVAQAMHRPAPAPAAGVPAPPPASAAAALLARSGNVAPPIARPPSIPPAAGPPFPGPSPAVAPPGPAVAAAEPLPLPRVASAEPTAIIAPRKSSAGKIVFALVAVVALLGAGAAAVFFSMRPTTGTLKIYISGPGGRDVQKVDVFVDGRKECESSPCTLRDVKPGVHDVKAVADGYQRPAPKGVEVKAGEQTPLNLELKVASAGTGFQVAGGHEGIKLLIDDKEVGPLPQTVKDLSPGDHKIKFVSSERYKPDERTVSVVPDKIEDLGTVKLKVLKGKATLKLVTHGARILLVPSTGDKRQIDERMFVNGQLSVDIDTTKDWRIEATKTNMEDLRLPITFEEGQAEKTFVIELLEKGKARPKEVASVGGEAPAPPAAGKAGGGEPPASGGGETKTAPGPATGGGDAKLNINSIPPSAVLIDGRPVGKTPKSGVSVPPGTHTITFIHPEKGRKATSVTVKAGETKGVGVKF